MPVHWDSSWAGWAVVSIQKTAFCCSNLLLKGFKKQLTLTCTLLNVSVS